MLSYIYDSLTFPDYIPETVPITVSIPVPSPVTAPPANVAVTVRIMALKTVAEAMITSTPTLVKTAVVAVISIPAAVS